MNQVLVVLGLIAAASAEIYTSDLNSTITAELALIRAIYGDLYDEINLGSFSTEDFTLKNIRMKGLNRIQLVGPSQMYVNTEYLTALTQGVFGVENAEFFVEEFKAPYLFYEGDETLYNVSFTVEKVNLNIHEGIHFTRPKSCEVSYGMEFLAMDGSVLHVNDARFDGKDVTPFIHYTVRFAINDYLASHLKQLPQFNNCIPFVDSAHKVRSYLASSAH